MPGLQEERERLERYPKVALEEGQEAVGGENEISVRKLGLQVILHLTACRSEKLGWVDGSRRILKWMGHSSGWATSQKNKQEE